jgi:CxxC motif-containing protein
MTTAITHYLCIGCPLGCRLEVEEEDGAIVEVRGFSCKLGKEYAEREHTDPRRMVSSTVRVANGLWARLPVKTNRPVPKDKVRAVCRALRQISIAAPVSMGDVIAANILDSGADIVAARDMPAV